MPGLLVTKVPFFMIGAVDKATRVLVDTVRGPIFTITEAEVEAKKFAKESPDYTFVILQVTKVF